jgi:hypothetical protein
MKKITLLLVAIFISASGFSQEIDFGAKAGVNFSGSTGFLVGGFAGMKLGEKMGLQADLVYSSQGIKIQTTTATSVSEEKIDLSYVNIPIVFKYYIFEGLNIQAGPQFGFKISDKVDSSLQKDKQKAKSLAIAGVIGVGYELPMGFRVEARYNIGFADVLEPLGSNAQIPGLKNDVLSLAVGYSFL